MKLYLLILCTCGMYASGNHMRFTKSFGSLLCCSVELLGEMNIRGSNQNISMANFMVIVLLFSSILNICILLNLTNTSVVSFIGGGFVSLLYSVGMQISSMHKFELANCKLKVKLIMMIKLTINFIIADSFILLYMLK